MKKTFLYLFTALILGNILTSCLGDTNATIGREGSYCIVRNDNGVAQTWTEAGLAVTFTQMNTYAPNDILIADFQVDMGNVSSNGLYVAEPFTVRETYPAADHIPIRTTAADTLAESNPDKFHVLNVSKYSGNEYFKDRWLFHSEATFREGQYMKIEFIYDRDKQVNNRSAELPANEYVIDVKLEITNNTSQGTPSIKAKDFVVDFSSFRRLISPNITVENTDVPVKIWFRFYKDTDTTRPSYDQNMGGLIFSARKNDGSL